MKSTGRKGRLPLRLGAPLALWIAIAPAGCEGTTIIGSADAHGDTGSGDDSPWDATPDTPAEPTDPAADVEDVPIDSPADLPVDPPHDSSTDSPADPGADEPPDTTPDAFPDAYPDWTWIPCDIAEQTGCPAGGWCAMMFDEESCSYYETCAFGEPGTLEPGEDCTMPATELCAPGSDCFYDDFDGDPPWPTSCHEWCRTDADCTVPGATCSFIMGSVPGLGPCAGLSESYPLDLCWI